MDTFLHGNVNCLNAIFGEKSPDRIGVRSIQVAD
jgi:hypothetical protein